MTARKTESGKKPKIEKLELNKETVQDLTEVKAEAVQGGGAPRRRAHRERDGSRRGRPDPDRPYRPERVWGPVSEQSAARLWLGGRMHAFRRVHPAAGLREPLIQRRIAMTEKSKSQGSKPKVENLELNKETVQDLTDEEAAAAEGGLGGTPHPKPSGDIGAHCPIQSNQPACPQSGYRGCPQSAVRCPGPRV
jgi:hypothetical protein